MAENYVKHTQRIMCCLPQRKFAHPCYNLQLEVLFDQGDHLPGIAGKVGEGCSGIARGTVAAVAPRTGTATKNYCCVSDSYYITITFFFLREVFCGLEYTQNAFAAVTLPWTPLAELMTLPQTS